MPIRVRREMGVTRAELFRLLPAVFGDVAPPLAGNRVTFLDHRRRLEIVVSEERERVLSAAVRLPYVEIEFVFSGYSGEEAARFLERFDRQFQKAGG